MDSVTEYLFAPGIDPKKLDITLQQNVLGVTGEREITPDAAATYHGQERFSGDFATSWVCRTISIRTKWMRRIARASYRSDCGGGKSALEASKIEANLKDGLPTVRIPKRAELRPRRIEVKS